MVGVHLIYYSAHIENSGGAIARTSQCFYIKNFNLLRIFEHAPLNFAAPFSLGRLLATVMQLFSFVNFISKNPGTSLKGQRTDLRLYSAASAASAAIRG